MLNVFEQLELATRNRTIGVTAILSIRMVKGYKHTRLLCDDGVVRTLTYQGPLRDALPNWTIVSTDISLDMSA